MARYYVPGAGKSLTVAGRTLQADSEGYFASVDDSTEAGLAQCGQRVWSDTQSPVSGAASAGTFVAGESFGKLRSTLVRLGKGVALQPRMVLFGDSVAEYVAGPLADLLRAKFGGLNVGGLDALSIASTSGGVADVVSDYSYWPNGRHTTFAAGGVRIYTAPGGQLFLANTIKVFFVTTPGGGNVTVDVIDATTGVWQTQAANTQSATVGLMTVTITGTWTTPQRLRITGGSGSVVYVGAAAWNTAVPGVVVCRMGVGGINLVDANSAPMAIVQGVMTELAPDLVTYSMREVSNDAQHLADPESWITSPTSGVPAIVSKFGAAVKAWLFVAPTAAAFDAGLSQAAAPSYREGAALKAVAATLKHSFVDSWAILGNWEAITSRADPGNDGIHVGPLEVALLADAAIDAMGVNSGTSQPLYAPAGRFGYAYSVKFFPVADVSSTPKGQNYGGTVDDLQPTVTRWLDVRHTSGLRALRLSTGAGSDGGAGAIIASGAHVQNASYYEANGEYGIYVHPTTGVATLYGRVGGTLKTLVLGTLA